MKKTVFFLVLMLLVRAGYSQQYPTMIKVEGGRFKMGDIWGVGDADERQVHKVNLSSFSMAQTETTVLQWKTYCSATGHKMPETPSRGWIDSCPIVNVSYADVIDYCNWLSIKMGKIYRLPTEAEWEYAARGGKLSKEYRYSGGESIDDVGWYKENNGGAQPVAGKKANELGLYDMSGNVWEWCQDWYGAYVETAQTNPSGLKMGSSRVMRGGSWYNVAAICRVTNRSSSTPSFYGNNCGFRVVAPE